MSENNIIPIIVSIFHNEPLTNPILNKSTNTLLIYLQEFIKHKIINKNTITKNDILTCENICNKLGINNDNIYNVYTFILDIFNIDKIETNDDRINIITL